MIFGSAVVPDVRTTSAISPLAGRGRETRSPAGPPPSRLNRPARARGSIRHWASPSPRRRATSGAGDSVATGASRALTLVCAKTASHSAAGASGFRGTQVAVHMTARAATAASGPRGATTAIRSLPPSPRSFSHARTASICSTRAPKVSGSRFGARIAGADGSSAALAASMSYSESKRAAPKDVAIVTRP